MVSCYWILQYKNGRPMFTKCQMRLTHNKIRKWQIKFRETHKGEELCCVSWSRTRWGHPSPELLPRAGPPSIPCATSSSPPQSGTWSWCAVRASPHPQESRKVEEALVSQIWNISLKITRKVKETCKLLSLIQLGKTFEWWIDQQHRTSVPRPLASTSRSASTTCPIPKPWVGFCTDGGTRSVMKVLFISFQKFLLQFFSCLAAQHL